MLKEAASDFQSHRGPALAAAVAYYAFFSLAPLTALVFTVAGRAFGDEPSRQKLVSLIGPWLGREAAESVHKLAVSASEHGTGPLAPLVGTVALLAGASGVFAHLQQAMDAVWETKAPDEGFWGFIRESFRSFLMVLLAAVVLLALLASSTVLEAGLRRLSGYPGFKAGMTRAADLTVTFLMLGLLSASLYRYLPRIRVEWQDVWFGAGVAAALATVLKPAFTLYLTRADALSGFGAAGVLAAVLVWANAMSQIFLFGAEVTRRTALRHGGPPSNSKVKNIRDLERPIRPYS